MRASWNKSKLIRAIKLLPTEKHLFKKDDNGQLVERLFRTVEEAASFLKVSPNLVRNSMNNPLHISNRIQDWSPTTVRGKEKDLSTRPAYRFEEVPIIRFKLYPQFDDERTVYEFSTVKQAGNYLRMSRSGFYLKLQEAALHDGIFKDTMSRPWKVEEVK